MNIALIGYRGTGKTTVAKHLATALACDWIDSDDEIERVDGRLIADIFADEGEAHFRDLETACLRDLTVCRNTVLSLGGGAVMRRMNRKMLADFDHVVWLTADVDTIHQRIISDDSSADHRPDLTIAGGREEIAQLLAERTPLYRECATLEVDTFDKPPEEVACEILAHLAAG